MAPDEWLAQLRDALPPPPVEDPGYDLGPADRAALLDLARVAAHGSERWTAPLSTFLAGVAFSTTPPDERTAALRALVAALEPPADDAG